MALKEIRRTRNEEETQKIFKRELDVLSVMRAKSTKHLIKAIAAYKYEDTAACVGAFAFPWAEGSLFHFWKCLSDQHGEASIIEWMLEQVKGIAEALHELHQSLSDDTGIESFPRGDLKPANILWFSEGDARDTSLDYLVISNVGSEEIHQDITTNRPRHSLLGTATKLYSAPEITTRIFSRWPLSRQYDIWSLGCIIFEFIIWQLYGTAGLEKFQQASNLKMFHEPGDFTEPRVHRWVDTWASHMRRDPRCQAAMALRQLLDIVLNKMLLVKPTDRITADRLAFEVAEIYENVKKGASLIYTGHEVNEDMQLPQHKSTIAGYLQRPWGKIRQ